MRWAAAHDLSTSPATTPPALPSARQVRAATKADQEHGYQKYNAPKGTC